MINKFLKAHVVAIVLLSGLLASIAGSSVAYGGAWIEGPWTFRRGIDVLWESDRATGDELAMAEFYTAGHAKPNGQDIRVATDMGRIVPSKVLMSGPGDFCRIIFNLVRGERRYWVYFGNPNPAAPPKGTDDVPIRRGLLLESRAWPGGIGDTAHALEVGFERARDVIGVTMVEKPMLGTNPFEDRAHIISKMTGSLFAPVDGTYLIAGAAHNRGALYLDGKCVLFVPNFVPDIRHNCKIELKRGRHDFVFYYLTLEGEARCTLGWHRPDSPRADAISREAFGLIATGTPGFLEERGKGMTADFKGEYVGECFYAYHYSYRYRFTANAPKAGAAKVEWEFSDGQKATGATVDHVFMADGPYEVKIRFVLGPNNDTQTTKMTVSRDRRLMFRPPTDEPSEQSAIVARYDVNGLPAGLLPWVVTLHSRAHAVGPMLAAAGRLAVNSGDLDAGAVVQTLMLASKEAIAAGKLDDVMKMWDTISPESRLQPRAACEQADLLMWYVADFAKAVKVLTPFGKKEMMNTRPKRLYAQALILSQKGPEGKKILESIPEDGFPDRRAAVSGAMARTIEYYITEGDWETGVEAWDRWQTKFPSDFAEGYSVLLQTKLIELRKSPDVAAKVAEAFANAMPTSSYSPTLLDRAAKLLAKIDPAKSKALHAMLKEKYPEDPLSQDK